MRILFFDTETTGLYKFGLPASHDAQPHIVQLAAQLCDDDGSVLGSASLIVDNGVEIPEAASNIHGITTEKARLNGVSNSFMVGLFLEFYLKADLTVAHNIKFDKVCMETALARHYPGRDKRLSKPLFCTMEASASIVDLPPTEKMRAAGFNKPKPPKLEECVQFFFGEKLEGAHDALIDVNACRRVYFELKRREAERAAA